MDKKKSEKQKRPLTVAEMAEEGKKIKGIKVTRVNEPNMKLMAQACINLYYDNLSK